MFVEILTSFETRKLNKLFTYKVPNELEDLVEIGQSIKVPFGNNNKLIRGYILKISEVSSIDEETLKSIDSIDYSKTKINKELLNLAVAVKDKYFLSLASILKLMNIRTINYRENLEDKCINLKKQIGISELRKSNKKELLEYLLENGSTSYLKLIEIGIKKETIRKLLREDILYTIPNKAIVNSNMVNLNEEQMASFNAIKESILNDKDDVFLLKGVTGSGKTEIYFRAIEEALKKGKQVLVLMPEINLTEDIIDRFEKVFPDNVVKWHSKVSEGSKKKIWDNISSREKNIIIGPRSAVFTTFKDLGLIIVDEEHDNSYYQGNNPSYNGRDVAILRGKVCGCNVILGSATPSVNSYNKGKKGEYRLLEINRKYYGQNHPEIEIVDMGKELKAGNFSIISGSLKEKIIKTINKEDKVLLYLNRRGFNNFIMCRDCGYVAKCPDCKLPLTYHKNKDELLCHYCGYSEKNLHTCPNCNSKRIKGIGVGTEKIVKMISEVFPDFTVARLDSDIKGGIDTRKKIIESFKQGEIDILVGTQILSKGLDFPNVSLVGIILGDTTLNIPDYRAREWTFQSLVQIIGRTGRREKKGEVILQTYQPFDIIYKDIKNYSYEDFYKKEIEFRKKLGYPPFKEILKLNVVGEKKDEVIEKIWKVYEALNKTFGEEMYKPQPGKIEKIKNMYRWQIIIKTDDYEKIGELGNIYYELLPKLGNNINFYIERNPVGIS